MGYLLKAWGPCGKLLAPWCPKCPWVLINSPIIKPDKKVKILGLIFKNKVQETTFLFLKTITLKKRESLLKTIIESLIDLFKKQKNIEVATIKTAVKLDGKLEKHILNIMLVTLNKTK